MEAIRYFFFKLKWRYKNKKWKDGRHKSKAMEKDWEKSKIIKIYKK